MFRQKVFDILLGMKDTQYTFQHLVKLRSEIFELTSFLKVTDPAKSVSDGYFFIKTRVYAFSPEYAPYQTKMEAELKRLCLEWETCRKALSLQYQEIVPKVARKFFSSNDDLEDLCQEGQKGLLRAIDLYDPDFGVPFEAYATLWIKKFIRQMVTGCGGLIRLPDSTLKKNRKIYEKNNLPKYQALGEDCFTVSDPNAEEIFITQETSRFLNEAINKLPPIKRQLINQRFLKSKKKSLEKISQEIGLSRERVRQLETEALKSIKKKFEANDRRTSH